MIIIEEIHGKNECRFENMISKEIYFAKYKVLIIGAMRHPLARPASTVYTILLVLSNFFSKLLKQYLLLVK